MTSQPETASTGAPPVDGDGASPRLSVAAVARRLGVAPATLRTWDRRYGLGPTAHRPGTHRRYGAADLARLELMQRALVEGVTPGEAAAHALAARLPERGDRPVGMPRVEAPAGVREDAPDPPLLLGAGGTGTPEGAEDLGARVRVGGGVLRLAGADRRARGIGRAALSLDSTAVRRQLDEAVEVMGLVRTWDEVARPVLRAIAERWESTGAGVEIEHLVSESVAAVYGARALAAAEVPGPGRPVLLAAMPDEWHHLPMTVLAAVLAERGVPHRPLGAALPSDALVAAVRRTAPVAVVLWSQDPGTADPAVLAALPRTRPRFRSFTAGPGWRNVELPGRVIFLESLSEAAEAMATLTAVTHRD